jgi:CBS domain-containing protein
MHPYAWEYDDRYDAGIPRGRGGPRRYPPEPPRGYDRGFRRGGRYGAFREPYGGMYRGGAGTGEGGYDLYRGYSAGGRAGRGYPESFDIHEVDGSGGLGYGGGPPRGGVSRSPSRSISRGLPGTGDVDSVRAADIMTRNPEAVTPETPVLEVARRMRDLDVGVMPVVDDADSFCLEGIVTDRDIAIRAAAEGKDMKKTPVREIMSARPQTVGENDHVRDVFTVMKRARVRRVPVTDADGCLIGIIAQADLAVNYAGLDLQRETEVEEVIERISEPARPRWGRDGARDDDRGRLMRRFRPEIDMDLPDRMRAGWNSLRREAREFMRRGYDRGWR